MKKKLLITVGAGASIDFGLPSVSEVDSLFDTHAGQLFPLTADPTSNLYRYCRDAIENYYGTASKPELRKSVNFEEMLYQLNLLVPHHSDPMRKHGSNALLASILLPEVLHGNSPKAVDGNVLRHMGSALIDGLVDHFIDVCNNLTTSKAAELAQLREFLAALSQDFDIGIVTLNYDNVFTQACPGLYTGFDSVTGRFEPLSVLQRSDWNFIYHLHGSVHFVMSSTEYDMHGINWTAIPSKGPNVHSFGRNNQESIEGVAYPTSTIVAGYGKSQQILRQPFRTYYSQVNRLVHEADCLLFLGYGFSDMHLNAVFSEARDRSRPTVIVDWARDNQDALAFREDLWSHQLFKTLPGNAKLMSSPNHSAPAVINELKKENEVEVSTDSKYPMAVWYNGLLEACKHSAKIITHLK